MSGVLPILTRNEATRAYMLCIEDFKRNRSDYNPGSYEDFLRHHLTKPE